LNIEKDIKQKYFEDHDIEKVVSGRKCEQIS